MNLPGGTQAARQLFELGSDEGRARGELLLDFGHRYIGWYNEISVRHAFVQYVKFLQSVNDAAQGWPDGCRLPAPNAPGQERNRVKDYVELLGLHQRDTRGKLTVEPDENKDALTRVRWLRAASIDVDDLIRRLNEGDSVKVEIRATPLPLPLPDLWRTLLPHDEGPTLLPAIIGERATWLLYAGLMSLDDNTLQFVATRPQLVRQLHDASAATFAAFGRSLHVHGLDVDLPGGSSAVPVWEALTGQEMTTADRFVRVLFEKDDGRLAWFYDTVSHLDGPHQRFVLGAHLHGRTRVEFVRDVYAWFVKVDPTWKVSVLPFARHREDPALVLASVDVREDGSVGPPWWPALLTQATDGGAWSQTSDHPVRNPKELPADAVWLLRWTFERPEETKGRFQVLRFAQRRFATVQRAEGPRVLIALTICQEMPALALSLERMGVLDVGVYADVGLAAHTITANGNLRTVTSLLAEWQGALALVEQIQRRQHLTSSQITPLLQSLVKSAPNRHARADGAIPTWLCDTLLPAFHVDTSAQDATLELTALRAFVRKTDAPLLTFSWEGQAYVLDMQGATVRDARAIRAATPGPTLDTITGLHSVRRRLEQGLSTETDAKDLAARLVPLIDDLSRASTSAGKTPVQVDELRKTATALAKTKDSKSAQKAEQRLPSIIAALDYATSVVLPSLVYAMAVAPTPQPPTIYAGQSSRHRFDDISGENAQNRADGKPWQAIAWRPPLSVLHAGGGTAVEGSLLLVDYALAESQMRTLVATDPSSSPVALDEGGASLIQTLLAYADAPPSKEDMDAVAIGIGRGRSLVESWRRTSLDRTTVRASLRAAGVGEARINVFEWAVERKDPSALDALTLSDLYRLGGGSEQHEFGVVGFALDGCACFVRAPNLPREEVSERVESGLAGASFTDLPIRVLEQLSDIGISSQLMPVILTGAIQDMRTHAVPFAPFDWGTFEAWTRRLPRDRVEEYLLGLIAAKLLVPPSAAGFQP